MKSHLSRIFPGGSTEVFGYI